MKEMKKLSVDVNREEAEKTPIAKKVFESYNKFQAALAPWDIMSEAAFHNLIAQV